MKRLDWKKASQKVERLIRRHHPADVYLVLNLVAPLRQRLRNGERTTRLYNEIMNLRIAATPDDPVIVVDAPPEAVPGTF